MAIDAHDVESVVLALGKGAVLVFPVTAPVIAALSAVLAALDAAGIVPQHTDALNVDQVRAQTVGASARASSAIEDARHPPAPATTAGDGAAAPGGEVLTSTVT